MSYAKLVSENQRLVILKCLSQAPAYSLASSHLRIAVNGVVAAPISTDALAAQLSWLQEVGVVQLDEVGGVAIARLKQRGLDVVEGAAVIPGIERLGPVA